MTIVVLLILAGIWAAVLVPPMLRARAEGRPADSIGDFRRRLTVLERTGPVLLAPANRLRDGFAPSAPGFPAQSRAVVAGAVVHGVNRDALRRQRTLRRRRDVLVGLLVAMGGSLLLGFLPALRVLWLFHVGLDLCFAGYVTLLVRLRNLAAERSMKIRVLPGTGSLTTVEPALVLQRSAN